MKMNLRTINVILVLLCFNPIFGQTNLIIPNKGIYGSHVVIDTTNISDVIKIYGNEFNESKNAFANYFRYEKIGLTFQTDPYDKNQIVRKIFVESPFQAKTEKEIVLNESTMKDVWNTYNSKGCFTSKSYAWNAQNGISFYIRKDSNDKGYDTSEKIYKIEVNNDGDFGISSRSNFEFNNEPVQKKLTSLIAILESDNFDFESLESFWSKEKATEKEPYGLEKQTTFSREIQNNLIQENIEIVIVGSSYDLNIFKSNNGLEYLKLSDNEKRETLIERIENPKLENTDLDVYTYGTFCGIAGTPPDKCQEMLELVRKENYKELSKWLKSINPEVATYGYIGLEFLNQRGIVIALTDKKRMDELSIANIQLNTCQGCIFGVTEKISEVLKKQNLKQMYRSFEQSGWLK